RRSRRGRGNLALGLALASAGVSARDGDDAGVLSRAPGCESCARARRDACAPRRRSSALEALFRRRFFLVHLAMLGVCAFLAARAVNVVVGHVLVTKLGAQAQAKADQKRPRVVPQTGSRNFAQAADSNIFEGRREVVVPQGAAAPQMPKCDTAECYD